MVIFSLLTEDGFNSNAFKAFSNDPIDGHTEVSIAAAGATFRVAPLVEHAGRVRVVVELPGARLGTLEGPSLPADNGAILALRANEDDAGARITIDIVAGARFEARTGAGGLLLVIQCPPTRRPARSCASAASWASTSRCPCST